MNKFNILDKTHGSTSIEVEYEGDCTSEKIIAKLITHYVTRIKQGKIHSVYIRVLKDGSEELVRKVGIRNDEHNPKTAMVTDEGFCRDKPILEAVCTKNAILTEHGTKHLCEIDIRIESN